jgi:hypothetical protein
MFIKYRLSTSNLIPVHEESFLLLLFSHQQHTQQILHNLQTTDRKQQTANTMSEPGATPYHPIQNPSKTANPPRYNLRPRNSKPRQLHPRLRIEFDNKIAILLVYPDCQWHSHSGGFVDKMIIQLADDRWYQMDTEAIDENISYVEQLLNDGLFEGV